MRKITMTANETTITITERDGKCLYQISGVPNRDISKAVDELRVAGVTMATAVKMLAPIVLK
jgi:hypothetical protein